MKGFYAVFRKEMAGFFVSPIAYVVITIFLVITGFIFWANVSYMSILSLQASGNPMIAERINLTDFIVRPLMQNMAFVMLFLMPLLTMKLFAEEKKSGSIELLLTYPITDAAVVIGKFLAVVAVLTAMLAGTLPSIVLLFGLGEPDKGTLVSGYIGLLLMGGAFLALGIFISSVTENQIIAAVISFGMVLLFWIISWSSSLTSDAKLGTALKQLSILEHMDTFNKGIIAVQDVSYFILFIAFFMFMTLRSLETHRWRG
jgi:ABC-2 type transport system permease protein